MSRFTKEEKNELMSTIDDLKDMYALTDRSDVAKVTVFAFAVRSVKNRYSVTKKMSLDDFEKLVDGCLELVDNYDKY